MIVSFGMTMKYKEFKTKLRAQQRKTLELIEQAGYKGINTKSLRSYEFIVMPTTRRLEINKAFKQYNIPKYISKRTEKDRTATYYLVDVNTQTGLFEKPQVKQAKFEVVNGIYIARI